MLCGGLNHEPGNFWRAWGLFAVYIVSHDHCPKFAYGLGIMLRKGNDPQMSPLVISRRRGKIQCFLLGKLTISMAMASIANC